MAVCRRWRDGIILWTMDQFKSLRLSQYKLDNVPHSDMRIGQLVHEIVISRYTGNHQTCLDELVKAFNPSRLQSLVLSGVRLNIGHFTGSVSMRQLGHHLRYLQLEEAWGTADIFSVLGCCPRLTHFSLLYGHSKETRLVNNNQLKHNIHTCNVSISARPLISTTWLRLHNNVHS